uniref:Uncharacterized protein n=1 Tax=Anguilla anguilla TaxID=7936 RepID=A0A0E9XG83_ANGAN
MLPLQSLCWFSLPVSRCHRFNTFNVKVCF